MTRITNAIKNNNAKSFFYKVRWNLFKSAKFPHFFDKDFDKDMVIIVASAQRAGSNWLLELIKDIGNFKYGKLDFDNNFPLCIDLGIPKLGNYFYNLRGRNIYKTHSEAVPVLDVGSAKVISIYRDPRDVITSCAFYLGRISEKKGGASIKYRTLDDGKKIAYIINNALWLYKPIQFWYKCNYSYNVCYEKLLIDPMGELKQIFDFLKIEVNNDQIQKAVEENSFQKCSGRKPGEEDKYSFFRKGISADWKNYFNNECIKLIKESNGGIWNKLIVEMGYEKNLDWT